MHEIQADEVLEIASKRGLPWIDREIAMRIAAGAQLAVAALREPDGGTCGDDNANPAHAASAETVAQRDFLSELMALARSGA
jgi:hypothetical protein